MHRRYESHIHEFRYCPRRSHTRKIKEDVLLRWCRHLTKKKEIKFYKQIPHAFERLSKLPSEKKIKEGG